MRRFGNPTGDVMIDLDPWRSSCVVEVVKEAHEAPWHDKEAFRTPNGPNDPFCGHLWFAWCNGPFTLEGMVKMVWFMCVESFI